MTILFFGFPFGAGEAAFRAAGDEDFWAGEVGLRCVGEVEVAWRAGEVALRAGEVGLRAGDVGLRSGEVALRAGEVGLRAGEVTVDSRGDFATSVREGEIGFFC